MDNGQNDKAAVYFNKLLISEFVNEYDPILYNAYSALASIYEMKQETILAKNCHDKCQEFLLKSYIVVPYSPSFLSSETISLDILP